MFCEQLVEQDSFETLYKLVTPLLRQLVEILLAPFDGGRFGRAGNVEQCPVGLATFKGNKKTSMFIRHVSDNLVDESLTRLDQSSRETGSPVMSSKPDRNSSEISFRLGARTSDIGRPWPSR